MSNKKQPQPYQPKDCTLTRVAKYAAANGLTPARIYQKFQEGDVNIVDVDGYQMVKIDKRVVDNG